MTIKQVKELYLSGHELIIQFTWRGRDYYIGEKRITERQADAIKKEFASVSSFRMTHAGLTKHYYKIDGSN